MNGVTVLIAGTTSFMLTSAATVVLGRLALMWGFVDRPGGHKAHARPVPYLGGVAIVLGTILPVAVLAGFDDRRSTAIMVAAVAVATLGLIDDLSPLTPRVRLLIESTAASGVVLSGVEAPITGGWLDGPITVIWIVVVTNSFNLLDNMDGALGAIAAVGAACLAASAFVHGELTLALLLFTLALACLGFLRHNWTPAQVFMGDAGSLFIGFVIASSAAAVSGGDADGQTAIAGLVLPAFVAIVDTGVVLLSRRRAGRPLLTGGTDHLSHRLRRLGLSTNLATLSLATAAAAAGFLNLMMALEWTSALVLTVTAAGVGVVLIGLAQRVHVYTPAVSSDHPSKIGERR